MKNTIILILSLLVIGLGSYVIFDKVISKGKTDEQSNVTDVRDNNTSEQVNVGVEDVFNNFVKSQNLTTSDNNYDSDSLKKMNCENAISASGKGYTLEMFAFKNVESAKAEYQNQKNYQTSTNNQKQLLSSKSNNSYDIYEAIMVPDSENAPAANGDEVIYALHLRKDNYLIILFQSSTSADKTTYINLGSELKTMLGIN